MKIVHIINGLKDGGTEQTLFKICKYDIKNQHIVISLSKKGKYFLLLKKINIKVYCIDLKYYSVIKFFSLIKLIKFLKPNTIQTWLAHGDFIGGLAAKLGGFNQIVWNIRYSKLDKSTTKLTTLCLIRILSKLSFIIPKLIAGVSKSVLKNCKDLGYCKKKLRLIYNGYELVNIKSSKLKINFRKRYKVQKNIPILGAVARYDETKDHTNLLKALSILKKKNINFLFLLVGRNINTKNNTLINQIKEFRLSNSVKLLGSKNNILQIMSIIDMHILSSKTEGFPNVVAEAMSCGTPCVVTDVGDSASIVGKTGWVVPPNNPIKLANAIAKGIAEIDKKDWQIRCNQSKLRIKNNFGIDKMIKLYNLVWSEANVNIIDI